MYAIKYAELGKYKSNRYKRVNFIYFLDKGNNKYCLPVMAILEEVDNPDVILNGILEKYNITSKFNEVVQYGKYRFFIIEFIGDLDNLVSASDIISSRVTTEVTESGLELVIKH